MKLSEDEIVDDRAVLGPRKRGIAAVGGIRIQLSVDVPLLDVGQQAHQPGRPHPSLDAGPDRKRAMDLVVAMERDPQLLQVILAAGTVCGLPAPAERPAAGSPRERR